MRMGVLRCKGIITMEGECGQNHLEDDIGLKIDRYKMYPNTRNAIL